MRLQFSLSWMAALLVACLAAKHGKHGKHAPRDDRVSSNDSGALLFPRNGSPQEIGLRSSPPRGDLPPLVETPKKMYDPRPQDINVTELRHKMGKSFDPNFMSVHRPLHFRNQTTLDFEFAFRKNRRGRLVAKDPEDLPDWLRELRFRYLWLPDGSKARTTVSSAKLERKLQNYLWAHTSCPVVFRWRDFGRRFWPRWVKEGHCPPGKQSCSIPPGMSCQHAGSEYKPLLRWHCQDWENARRCQWIRVHYPIVTKCACACPTASAEYK